MAKASLMSASPGDKFMYQNAEGYGELALGEPLTAEMTELDLHDGTEVEFVDYDEATGWPIVSWTDSTGINRITTIDEQYVNLFPAA